MGVLQKHTSTLFPLSHILFTISIFIFQFHNSFHIHLELLFTKVRCVASSDKATPLLRNANCNSLSSNLLFPPLFHVPARTPDCSPWLPLPAISDGFRPCAEDPGHRHPERSAQIVSFQFLSRDRTIRRKEQVSWWMSELQMNNSVQPSWDTIKKELFYWNILWLTSAVRKPTFFSLLLSSWCSQPSPCTLADFSSFMSIYCHKRRRGVHLSDKNIIGLQFASAIYSHSLPYWSCSVTFLM